MKAIENLDDLHNLFFSEWLLPFVELKNTDLILELFSERSSMC